jgi:ABC-type transport system substrate-binding protein
MGAATLGAGAAALSLVGCGGSSKGSSSSQPQGSSGLLSVPIDTTSKAKAGGVFKSFKAADVPSLDPLSASSIFVYNVGAYTYPRLFKFKVVKYPDFPPNVVEGDLVESYELSGDKLQITAKLRQGLKWDARPPTSGREIDAQDVVFSFNKFAKLSGGKTNVVYTPEVPTAPVESMVAVDKNTLQIKMKQPNASVLELLGSLLFFVMPRESDGGFDPKGDMRGYGPWTLQEWKTSQSFIWKKNPDYYLKGRPYMDTMEEPIVTEYATQLSQFRAGGIWGITVKQEDIIPLKKDIPALVLQANYQYARSVPAITFGVEGDSPFKDERMRQAVSMLVDRAGVTEFLSNKSKFEAEGLQVPERWATMISADWEGAWTDPRDEKNFGANSKYYKRDVAEAKKLIAAAGYPNGVDTTLNYPGNPPVNIGSVVAIYADNLRDGGIRGKATEIEYVNGFVPNFLYAYIKGGKGYNGMAVQALVASPTVPLAMYTHHHKDGSRFQGASPDGVTDAHLGDPTINAMIEKAMVEFDKDKQNAIAQDFARYSSGKMYWINTPNVSGYTIGFTLAWPVIGNRGVYRSSQSGIATVETDIQRWIDDTQAPLGKPS